MRQFWVLFKLNLLIQFRSKEVLFWCVVFPILMMGLFGLMFGSTSFQAEYAGATSGGGGGPKLNFASYLVPGLIVMASMSNGIIGFANTIAVYREKGIFRRIKTTPLPIGKYILAKILVQGIFVILQAIILTVVGILLFGATLDWGSLPLTIAAVILIGLTFVAIGQMLAAIVPKSNTVAMISQMLNVPFMMLGGLFMPLSRFEDVPVLPQLGSLLPSGIAVNVLRPTFISEPFKSIPDVQGILLLPVWVSLAVLLGYLFLSIFVAARFFKWEV